ncbi:uncharacterized protein LOC142344038 isoform X2 [Convolutriloba macropyga]|uniref:uncharacterized protein LOC142344038 isoform X2 n=1 Tax=Convolutriloba macropyga TaxID=536237 RepID=UPI003F52651F
MIITGAVTCTEDAECEHHHQFVDQDVGRECCGDNECSHSCALDEFLFWLFVLMLPLCCVISVIIIVIAICFMCKSKSSSSTVSNYDTCNTVPTSRQLPPSYNANQTMSPYQVPQQQRHEQQQQLPTYQQSQMANNPNQQSSHQDRNQPPGPIGFVVPN